MKRMKKSLASLLAVVMMLSVLTACGGEKSGEESGKSATNAAGDWNVLTVGISTDPQTMDPALNSNFAPCQVRRNVYEPLFQFDEDYNVIPCLADSWEYLDDCTLKVHIDEDATFSNGEPVTSEDVMFMIEHSIGTAADTYTTGIDKEATYASIIDEKTFCIVTKEPSANQLQMLCHSFCGIFDKSDFEAKNGDFFAGIAGSGPYKFDSYVAGDNYVLVKDENYWNDESCPNRVGKIVFRILTESANRAIEAETGGVDIVFNVGASDIERVKANEELQYESIFTFNAQYIFLNMQHEILSNELVREAIKYAIDRETMVKMGFGEMGKVLQAAVVADLPGAADVSDFLVERNVEKAKEFLAQAGYPDGFTLKFTCDNSNQERMDAGEAMQAQLAEVGITLEIDAMDAASLTLANESGDHDITIYGYSAASGEAGSALVRFLPETATWPLTGYPKDDVLVDYIREGLKAIDLDERYEYYHKAQERIMELGCVIPLYSKEVNAVLAKYVDADSFRMEKSFETHQLWNVVWNSEYVQ